MHLRHPLLTLAVSSLIALAGSLPVAAQAPGAPVLDHFRCYSLLLGPQSDDLQVRLQDQFDVALGIIEDVWVGGPFLFCNPVEKAVQGRTGLIVTPIADPNAHLTFYRIAPQTVHAPQAWRVEISNQFGKQRLEVRRPRLLAVPTQKLEGNLAFPERLDHFKCYDARGKEIARRARLRDQFENELVAVLEPRLFCNPTRKTDSAGVDFPIKNAGGHLTCYDLSLLTPLGTTRTLDRVIANQFTGGSTGDIVVVTDEDLLCVPTRKSSVHLLRPPRVGAAEDESAGD